MSLLARKTGRQDIIAEADERLEDVRRFRQLGLMPLDGAHMPVTTYPPYPNFPEAGEDELFAGFQGDPGAPYSVYLSFPFCASRCTFCHLPLAIRASDAIKEKYVAAFEKEMELLLARLGLDRVKTRDILIGGGTPTECSPRLLDRYLSALTRRLDMSACTQFNLDTDPASLLGPVGLERMKILQAHGVDRITMGVQSFNDKFIKSLRRPHDSSQAVEAAARVKSMKIALGIELIYGLPEQTFDDWISDMGTALSMEADELHMYRLRILPFVGGLPSALTRQFSDGKIDWDWEASFQMKEIGRLMSIRAGYTEALSRVFKRDPESAVYSHYQDNMCCDLGNILALGPSANGYYGDVHTLNTNRMTEYYSSLEKGRLPIFGGIKMTKTDMLHWHTAIPLIGWGQISKARFLRGTGASIEQAFHGRIASLKKHGLLVENRESFRLTELGRFMAYEVAIGFLPDKFQPFPRSAYADGELNPFLYNNPLS